MNLDVILVSDDFYSSIHVDYVELSLIPIHGCDRQAADKDWHFASGPQLKSSMNENPEITLKLRNGFRLHPNRSSGRIDHGMVASLCLYQGVCKNCGGVGRGFIVQVGATVVVEHCPARILRQYRRRQDDDHRATNEIAPFRQRNAPPFIRTQPLAEDNVLGG